MKELKLTEKLGYNLSSRDKTLIERALKILEGNKYYDIQQYFDNRIMVSPALLSGGYLGVWNWDTAFHAVGLSRFDAKLAIDQIEGFFKYMLEDGMLPDFIDKEGNARIHSSKPPVFAWAAYEVYKNTGDIDFLKRIYNKLVLNENFWRTQRFDGKLFYYDAYLKGTDDEKIVWTKWESGLDNSVRWDNGIIEYYPVDLNCFMLSFYESMLKISQLIGEKSDEWESKYKELSVLIEETFWNDTIGAYTDKNRFTGEYSNCLTPESFMPLYVKTASKERAKKMAQIAADKNKFNSTMPSVSYDNKEFSNDYWRGPLWMNMAYFAAKGLKNYGFSVADDIKENVLNLVDGDKDGIYENYDTINNKGLCNNTFSWSACFIIEFILNW